MAEISSRGGGRLRQIVRTRLKWSLLALVALFGPAFFFAVLSQEMTVLLWSLPGAAGLWLLLFAFWYLAFGAARLRRRLLRIGAVACGLALLGGIGALLLRYEGSASGSSMPRFSWIWQEAERSSLPQDLEAAVYRPEDGELDPGEIGRAAGESRDFLGADRNGMSARLGFDPDWAASPPRLLWRRPVGRAWSSFAVAEGIAVTQEQAGESERVLALDLLTGEERWSHEDEGVRLLLVREENRGAAMGGDGPRSTPVVEGETVVSVGATGIVNALDLATGARRWTRQVIDEFDGEVQRWGQANAALIVGEHGLVVVPGSEKAGATLVAFDLASGETRWTYEGRGASYSSPRLLEYEGVSMLVSVNARDATGHDPRSGEVLWSYDWPGTAPKVGQALKVGEDRLLLTASYGAGSPLLRLSREASGWEVEELWRSTRMKTKFSSAVVLGDHVYGLDEGRLACVELATGERVWKREKFGFGQHLLFDDHLLVQTEPGEVLVGRLGPEGFVERGRLDALESMTWNVPVVAGRILLARNDREAVAYWLAAPESAE